MSWNSHSFCCKSNPTKPMVFLNVCVECLVQDVHVVDSQPVSAENVPMSFEDNCLDMCSEAPDESMQYVSGQLPAHSPEAGNEVGAVAAPPNSWLSGMNSPLGKGAGTGSEPQTPSVLSQSSLHNDAPPIGTPLSDAHATKPSLSSPASECAQETRTPRTRPGTSGKDSIVPTEVQRTYSFNSCTATCVSFADDLKGHLSKRAASLVFLICRFVPGLFKVDHFLFRSNLI